MPRVALKGWIQAVMSHGPKSERLRHLCHVLAFHMDVNGYCYPSQRRIGAHMGIDHKTAAATLRKLIEAGWLEFQEVGRQFGRTGHVYFAAAPDSVIDIGEAMLSPILRTIGEPISPQYPIGESAEKRIGESALIIGESAPRIGEPCIPRNSPESITEKSAASPSPAIAGSAAQRKLTIREIIAREQSVADENAWDCYDEDQLNRKVHGLILNRKVHGLIREGKSDEEISAELDVTPQFVALRRQFRNNLHGKKQ